MAEQRVFVLAQLNPIVGDIAGNLARLRDARKRAGDADLVITSELFLCAYPPEDLVLKPSFMDKIENAIVELARETADGGPALLVGAPWRENDNVYNAALLLDNGQVVAKIYKHDLPNYGPFDEKRIFTAAPLPKPVSFRGINLGVMICEDMWSADAAGHLKEHGAEILIVPNGSPFEQGKIAIRHELAQARVRETGLPLIYVNQMGGQDELVFDGASFALDATGKAAAILLSWHEDQRRLSWSNKSFSADPSLALPQENIADTYNALMIGLRDYIGKNGFPGVVLGMSGGIDSALSAAIAVDAIGADHVRGVMMPSPYTSSDSTADAQESARLLGFRLDNIPINEAMNVFDSALAPIIAEKRHGVTAENIQARCRGLILMATSNATGAMVLSTGNKSEMAVGYATLYGDMCGGFAVLKDVYKTQVYALAHWRNQHKPETGKGPAGPVIPERVLTKAPTAELRPNQTDQDSLPPYDVLDSILNYLIEGDWGLKDITAQGYDVATVARVDELLHRAEYKRRQSPPGVKITRRNLGRDRRYPITNKYRDSE